MSSSPNVLAFRMGQLPQRPAAAAASGTPGVLVGPSPAIARVWQQIRRVAPYFRLALLTGERGSGSEAAARALHSLSALSARPFTILTPADCEARLTGPVPPRLANETVYFPEVDHLSAAAQQGLLRLLRARRPQQICVIASARGDLRPLVSAGGFSGILATQLSALHIALPALRERREDIPAIATHLLAVEAHTRGVLPPAAPPSFLETLTEQAWPGNIDQLQTVLRRFLERHPGCDLDSAHFRSLLDASFQAPLPAAEPVRLLRLDQVVQEHIRAVLLRCNGNKLRAAEILGISRSTLYRMLDAQAAGNDLTIAS